MSLVSEATLKKVADHLPANVRSLAKAVYRRHRHWAHPAMKKFGTVQDLYYWVADGNLGTLLLLQNYFSVLYPALNTETGGDIYLYNKDGEPLGSVPFSVAHCSCARFRLSSLLEELQVSPEGAYGTLEVNIAIPREVLDHIQGQNGVYFWDRFYIGYTNAKGQTCFVHGVDKTHIFRDGKSDPVANWYKSPQDRQWAPEIPIDIDDYKKLNVDSFVERPVRDGPWSARVSGREAPRAVGCADLTALGAALRTSRIPCSTPSEAQGARWKLWSGALTRLRPQVPSRPPAEPCFPSPPGVHGPSA